MKAGSASATMVPHMRNSRRGRARIRFGTVLVSAQDQFDALLYLGPPSAITRSRLPPALCADPAYMKMRLERLALVGGPPGEAEQLKQYCATVVK